MRITSEARDNLTWANFGKHVTTLRGQILVSRTDDDSLPHASPSLPCVHPKRLRVYIQNVTVYAGAERTRRKTRARGAGAHGDVLNVHGVTFWMDTRWFQRATPTTTTQRRTREKNAERRERDTTSSTLQN